MTGGGHAGHARSKVGGSASADIEAISAALFTGPLAYWAGSVAFEDHADAVDAGELADKALFDRLTARFGAAYPAADRHAVASFWSQHYFSRLTIPLTALCIAAECPLAIDFRAVKVRFCPNKGTPLCFHLRCGGATRSPETLVKAFYEDQVATTVGHLKRHSGLSARLLWENVGSYGMWILGEMSRTPEDGSAVADQLLSDGGWPQAACAMLPHMKRAARDACPAVRRLCCLRYRLPGVSRCPGACPLAGEGER